MAYVTKRDMKNTLTRHLVREHSRLSNVTVKAKNSHDRTLLHTYQKRVHTLDKCSRFFFLSNYNIILEAVLNAEEQSNSTTKKSDGERTTTIVAKTRIMGLLMVHIHPQLTDQLPGLTLQRKHPHTTVLLPP